MVLSSLAKGRLIQTVKVNGLEHHRAAYDITDMRLPNGTELLLMADPDNKYDANAVRVAYPGVGQIGWVPRVCNHNIAALLRKGETLKAYVSKHSRARLDLEIEVYAPSQSPDSRTHGECLGVIKEIGQASNYSNGLAELQAVPVGTVLACDSNSGRSSIDVIVKCVRVAWFRKTELGRSDVDALAVRGELVAQVVGQRPTVLQLYRKGEAPNEVPVVVTTASTGSPISSENLILNNKKENTMNFSTTTLIKSNTDAATQAGYLEAGRIANNKVVQLSSKALPMMLRGYADTPIGKLVAANLAVIAAQQLRPQDAMLAKLTTAMQVAAYGEVIATVDIEGWFDDLMNSPEIKRAVSKMGSDDTEHLNATQANRDHLERSTAQAAQAVSTKTVDNRPDATPTVRGRAE